MRTSTVAEPPGTPPAGRVRQDARPADPLGFSAHLDESTARTAPAEGPPSRTSHEREVRPTDDRESATAPADAVVADQAPDPTGDLAGPVAPVPPADAAAPATAPAAATATAPTAVPVAPEATPIFTTVPGATAPESVPTPDPASPGVVGGTTPTGTAAVEGDGTEGVPTAAIGAPMAAGADADDLPAAGEQPAAPDLLAGRNVGSPASERTGTDVPPAEQGDAAPVPTVPQGAQQAGPAPAPAPAAAPGPPAALPAAWAERGLQQTVDRMIDLVHVATARGVARARLQLHPQELGGIQVSLRQSADGLVATITAQNREAVQAVAQAGAELRRSLEDRGLQLASLDIRLAADGGAGQAPWQQHAEARAQADAQRPATTRALAGALADGDPDLVTDPTPATAAPAGVLVDVVA